MILAIKISFMDMTSCTKIFNKSILACTPKKKILVKKFKYFHILAGTMKKHNYINQTLEFSADNIQERIYPKTYVLFS